MKQEAPFDWDQIKTNNDFLWWIDKADEDDYVLKLYHVAHINDTVISHVKSLIESRPDEISLYAFPKDGASFTFVRTFQNPSDDKPVLWIAGNGDVTASDTQVFRSADMYLDLDESTLAFRHVSSNTVIDPGTEFTLMSIDDDYSKHIVYE